MKNSVIVYIKGGCIQDIESSEKMNVSVVDFDTDGSPGEELQSVFYKDGRTLNAKINFRYSTGI